MLEADNDLGSYPIFRSYNIVQCVRFFVAGKDGNLILARLCQVKRVKCNGRIMSSKILQNWI